MFTSKQKSAGFTIIELVVVIVILGILAVTALPRIVDFKSDAEAANTKAATGYNAEAANIKANCELVRGVGATACQ